MDFLEQYKRNIYNGDCLEFMKQVPDGFFDLILTDPPYLLSNSKPGESKLMSLNKYNSQKYVNIVNGFDINNHLNEYKRILSKFNLFCFCSNKQISSIMTWGEKNNFYTTLLVWHKTNSAPFANGVWRSDLEFCIHIREKGAYFEGGSELKQKITTLPTNPSEFGHPTEKPLKLIKKYLSIGAKQGMKIFDPFLGSGTTAIAAESLGLDWWGCELESDYVEIAQQRIKTIQPDMFGI